MMQECCVIVDNFMVHLWSVKILPDLALIFCRRTRRVRTGWRLDDAHIKVAGLWKYLYRAVNKTADTVDFLLTAKRDKAAAQRYLNSATFLHGLPQNIAIDKSGANTAAIHSVNADDFLHIELHQPKHLHNIVEPDQRAVKRATDLMQGFKSFWSTQKLSSGIVTIHMIKKRQLHRPGGQCISAADQVYNLAH